VVKRLTAEKPKGVELADMEKLQMDVRDNLADDLLPVLLDVWQKSAGKPELADLRERAELATLVTSLEAWDRRLTRDSSAAVIFHAFSHLLAKRALEDDLSPLLFQIVMNSAPMYLLKIGMLAARGDYPNGDAVLQEGRERVILLALADTADFLLERFGEVAPSAYRYSDLRLSSMEHAYGRGIPLGKVPSDGGEATVNVAQSSFLEDGKPAKEWISHWGPIERQVFEFDADGTPRARYNTALGNSSDPKSPFHEHALQDWVDGNYRDMPYRRAEVDSHAYERKLLEGVKR